MSTAAPARRFVPPDLDCSDRDQIEPLFQRLASRSIDSGAALETWLSDVDELTSVLSEYGARRYIEMTCHTDDVVIEQRYLHFVEQVEPRCERWWHQLRVLYLESPHRSGLDQALYEVYERHVRSAVELFRDVNVPLHTKLTTLDQQYDKLCGVMTATFQGSERTLPQMARYQEEQDRDLRQAAWGTVAERRLHDRDEIETIFEQMLEIRQQIAVNADLGDYRSYAWKARGRFDYSPDDCVRFHQAVERAVVPLRDKLDGRRQADLGLSALRPWDLAVDPANRSPLRPFESTEVLVAGVETILSRLHPDFAREFSHLRARGALDVESRKGKAPGGYQYTLDEIREPFIFMNAAGVQRDVETLLHESGHAVHAAATRSLPLRLYRHAPFEFCEVASMAMEHLGRPHLDVFYNEEGAARARRKHLTDVIALIPWIATIDSFQHWLYTRPGHSREERRAAWVETLGRFYHKVDWTGWEPLCDAMWQRQGHLFGSPFYYIEYAIAQMGALQIWLQAKANPGLAIANYRRALSLGGSRPLPELFAAADIHFDFSERTLVPLMEAVEQELSCSDE